MTKLTACAPHALLCLLLTAGCKTLTGETARHHLDDTAITTSVKSRLAAQDRISSLTRISVKTVESTVYLSGKVTTVEEKTLAEEIARRVGGVKRVVNNLEVQP